MIESPKLTLFYTIERTIKEYRKFAERNIKEHFSDLTIDQALLIIFLNNNPSLSQSEIADLVFKDNASVTRMIELMVKKNYLSRSPDKNDRRRYKIELTRSTKKRLQELEKIIFSNRTTALQDVQKVEIETVTNILNHIIKNCN